MHVLEEISSGNLKMHKKFLAPPLGYRLRNEQRCAGADGAGCCSQKLCAPNFQDGSTLESHRSSATD